MLQKWYIANYVADASIGDGAYGYAGSTSPGLTPQHAFSSYPISESDTVHQYAAEYYNIQPTIHHGTLTISLKGDALVRIIQNEPYMATNEWWGNRYDNMDSTLTRSFDLTQVKGKRATLQFAAWFDLERDYDYAFVEVSTDGANWTTLKGHFTTNSNPNGANWGNGYTGVSGGAVRRNGCKNTLISAPISARKYGSRFEEVTDEAVNLQGFAIDHLSIPEIHFQDTLTTDNGWASNGFIRSNNVLPERFNVQALLYHGSQFTVNSVPVDLATGQGLLTIPKFGADVTRVVLIVSAYAAETTQLAHYQLDINVK